MSQACESWKHLFFIILETKNPFPPNIPTIFLKKESTVWKVNKPTVLVGDTEKIFGLKILSGLKYNFLHSNMAKDINLMN